MTDKNPKGGSGKPNLPWEGCDVPDRPETDSTEWHHAELNRILDITAKDGYEGLDDADIEFVVVHAHTGYVSLEEARHFLPEICRRLAAGESPFESDLALWLLFLKMQDEGILVSSEKRMIEDAFMNYAGSLDIPITSGAAAIINFAVAWQWDAQKIFGIWKDVPMFRDTVRDFRESGLKADEYFVNLSDGPRKLLPSTNPENYRILLEYVSLLSTEDSGG